MYGASKIKLNSIDHHHHIPCLVGALGRYFTTWVHRPAFPTSRPDCMQSVGILDYSGWKSRRWKLQGSELTSLSEDEATRGSGQIEKYPNETRRGPPKDRIVRQGLHPHPGPEADSDLVRDLGGGVWAYIFPEEMQHAASGSDTVDEPEEVWEVMRREWLYNKEQKRLAEARGKGQDLDDEELSRLVSKFLGEAIARKEDTSPTESPVEGCLQYEGEASALLPAAVHPGFDDSQTTAFDEDFEQVELYAMNWNSDELISSQHDRRVPTGGGNEVAMVRSDIETVATDGEEQWYRDWEEINHGMCRGEVEGVLGKPRPVSLLQWPLDTGTPLTDYDPSCNNVERRSDGTGDEPSHDPKVDTVQQHTSVQKVVATSTWKPLSATRMRANFKRHNGERVKRTRRLSMKPGVKR